MRISILAAAAALLLPLSPAGAQSLPAKALPAAAQAALNVQAGWSGFYAGANFSAAGQGVNLANLGTVSANGQSLGAEVGYENWTGVYLLGARAGIDYDVISPTGAASASFSSKMSWHVGGYVGGNLATIFNLQPPQLPAVFANAIPYVAIEACGHDVRTGECTSLGGEIPIPSSLWTVKAEYRNWQLGTGGNVVGQNATAINSITLAIDRHF